MLHWPIGAHDGSALTGTIGWSDSHRELVEGFVEPVAGGDIGGEFIVAAAKILDERVPGGQDPRGSAAFQAAHRPQPRFQPPVIGLDWIAGVPLDGVQGRGDQLVQDVGAENLCHQAIFLNQASGAVTPLNPELIQVSDTIGQRAQRRRLAEGSAGTVSVAGVLVLVQHDHQVPLVPDQGAVQRLPAAAADPPFHYRIHSRRLDRGADNPDASSPEHRAGRGGEAGVPVMQHELHPSPGILQVHDQVSGLLHHPGLDRMFGGAQNPHAAGAMLNHGKDVNLGAVEQVGGEEVQRQDLCVPKIPSTALTSRVALPAGWP